MNQPNFKVVSGESREMPASNEAEQQVIAGCLLDNGATLVRALQAGVTAKAFFLHENRTLWETMVELFRRSSPVTIETLADELATKKVFEQVGGFPYLMQVTGKIPTTAHVGHFIEILLAKSALRLAVRIGTETVENAYGYTGGSLEELFVAQLSALSAAIRHARRGGSVVSLADRIDAVVADTTAAQQGKLDKSGWIYTGLSVFDQRCMPLGCQAEDHLVVDAAGSGLGKSAFMRQVAGNTIERGQRVRAYSRETSTAGFIEQLASARASVDLSKRESWPVDQLKKFVDECAKLKTTAEKKWWCVDSSPATPLQTIEDLEDDARFFAATQGAPHLWIVDYLQLFGARKRISSREQEVAYVSHRLQALCRELGGVWLVGCQMNESGLNEMRTLKRDEDGKVIHRTPRPGDLRESQAIVHDADRIIAHYLPPVDSRDQDQTGPNILQPEVWLCQIKRRKGCTGVVKTWFEKRFTRFSELPNFSHDAAAGQGSGMTKQQFKGEKKR